MTQPLVSIVMGSRSDLDIMQASRDALREFDIVHETHVLTLTRTPDALFEHVANATSRGVEVFIAGAGGAAHLPGVIAAKTTVPFSECLCRRATWWDSIPCSLSYKCRAAFRLPRSQSAKLEPRTRHCLRYLSWHYLVPTSRTDSDHGEVKQAAALVANSAVD